MITLPDLWNPRYVQYARVHGHTPETMLEVDRVRCNSASMMYFMFWIQDKWRIFLHNNKEYKCGDGATNAGHKAFDAWLETLPVCILQYPLYFTFEY
jgi:hypothetical protein